LAWSSVILAILLPAGNGEVAAQDSPFSIRGLGLVGRPVSARTAATGGGFALFDPATPLNPAALGRLRAVAGWAVGAPSRRRFDAGGAGSLTSTRFPVFGFATTLGQRLGMAVSIGDYLDRTWRVRTPDTVTLRGEAVPVSDESESIGGISDLRLATAYRLSPTVTIGGGIHALTGSTRLQVTRDFEDTSYVDYRERSVTDFAGLGLSLGVLASPLPSLSLGASLRLNGELEASSSTGVRAEVGMPLDLSLGAQLVPARGVVLGATVGFSNWSRAADALEAAGGERSRDVWNLAGGLEAEGVRLGSTTLPLRLGYHWRQLPFGVAGDELTERALSWGFGFNLAGGRTTMDLALERGSRTAGGRSESFTTLYLGFTVRP
jgi:hypothetical protein